MHIYCYSSLLFFFCQLIPIAILYPICCHNNLLLQDIHIPMVIIDAICCRHNNLLL